MINRLFTFFFIFQTMISYGKGFIENLGQINKNTFGNETPLFYLQEDGINIFLFKSGMSYQFINHQNDSLYYHNVHVEFAGANKNSEIIKEVSSEETHNFYSGNSRNVVVGAKEYRKITLKNIYPAIDWVIYLDIQNEKTNLKYDFILHPGANPADLQILYKGADNFTVSPSRLSTNIKTSLGEVKEGALLVYYKNNKSDEVDCFFNLKDNILTFDLELWDESRTLVIDPPLAWSTYFGGGAERAHYMDLDEQGNMLLVGNVRGTDLPPLDPGGGAYYQPITSGGSDAFIAKFDNNGKRLWTTYIGGNSFESLDWCVNDQNNNFYIVGSTQSSDFPTVNTIGSTYFKDTLDGSSDAVIIKINSDGVLLYSSYFGGDGIDKARSIALDANGNLVVLGVTNSTNLPVLNPGGSAYFQSTLVGDQDAFLLSMNTTCNHQWLTYYGGIDREFPAVITADALGNIFIAGSTKSLDFPLLNPGGGAYYQNTASATGNLVLFISKFDANKKLEWSTFYEGLTSGSTYARDIKTNQNNELFVVGNTNDNNFPLFNPGGGAYYNNTYISQEGYILQFDNNGVRQWATYLGGNSFDDINHLAIDNNNELYIVGQSMSDNLPVTNPGGGAYFNENYQGTWDSYFAHFNQNRQIEWLAYYGGLQEDIPLGGIKFDNTNKMFIAGYTLGCIPLIDWGNGAYYQNTLIEPGLPGITGNLYLLAFDIPFLNKISFLDSICLGDSANLIAPSGISYQWTPAATLSNTTIQNPIATMDTTTTYEVIVSNNCGIVDAYLVTVIVMDTPTIIISNDTFICIGDTIALSASGGITYTWLPVTGLDNAASPIPLAYPVLNTQYTITVTDSNRFCSKKDSVEIIVFKLPVVVLGKDTTICPGDTLILDATISNTTYQWQDGSTDSVFLADTVGIYYVTVTDSNSCQGMDTINIIFVALPTVSLGDNMMQICQGEDILLIPQVNASVVTYNWQPNQNINHIDIAQPTVAPTESQTYTVVVSNICGLEDTAEIPIEVLSCSLFIPNAFSPNGDGMNDYFKVRGDGVQEFLLTVYNRWGKKVFETNNINEGWKGLNGKKYENEGVYVYMITGSFIDGSNINLKGNVTLIR